MMVQEGSDEWIRQKRKTCDENHFPDNAEKRKICKKEKK